MDYEEYWKIVGYPDSELPINDLPEEQDLKELLNALDAGIAGSQKPRVAYVREPYDRYLYIRDKLADKLQIPVSELADEPDNDPGSEEQSWA